MSKILSFLPIQAANVSNQSSAVTIEVLEEGTTNPVSLFSDEALTTSVSNPFTSAAGSAVPTLYHDFPGNIKVEYAQGSSTFDFDPLDDLATRLKLTGDEGARFGVAAKTPEMFGAAGNGTTNDSPAFADALASGERIESFGQRVYRLGTRLNVNGPASLNIKGGAYLTQADGENLAEIVSINISNGPSALQHDCTIVVDGNSANNTTSVVGIKLSKLKKAFGRADLAAMDCDTGIEVTDQVEYAQLNLHANTCTTGVHIFSTPSDQKITPDEIIANVFAHNCSTGLLIDGTNKMTGTIVCAIEQTSGWGVDIQQGWWQLSGIARGVGSQDTGGMRAGANAKLRGSIEVACSGAEWAFYAVNGAQLEALQIVASNTFDKGAIVEGGVGGSMQLVMRNNPDERIGLQLGQSTGPAVNDFHLLPGSELRGRADGTALVLERARSCVIELTRCLGMIEISSNSFDNTIIIPQSDAISNVTFTNNRTQEDNVILFRGGYNLSEMNAFNGGSPFKGMRVEACSTFDMMPCAFDGRDWTPLGGVSSEASAADIANIGASINTAGKFEGKLIWDSTNNRLYRASGVLTNDAWDATDASGSVTPS